MIQAKQDQLNVGTTSTRLPTIAAFDREYCPDGSKSFITKFNDGNVSLTVENLGCERNDQWLFSNLSFELAPGQLLQIDGVNGSGKTTLLRTVCGLLPADQGNVYWCGQPIRQNRYEYFSQLVFVGHKQGVKDELTAEENLHIDQVLAAKPGGLSAREALRRLGIEECGDQLCRQLSAGQRQRVALARLLISFARFWVLDEPLTALDQDAQQTVVDLVTRHIDTGGMVMITSHQKIDWGGQPYSTIRLGHA